MDLKLSPPLVFDGAFGTYYLSLTADQNPCELANLDHADVVRRIHRAYIEAGVDAIKTNTFSANPVLFEEERLNAVIEAGWKIACDAVAGTAVRVFADIGCNSAKTAADDFLKVARIFLALGAHDFLFETLDAYDPILPALAEIHRLAPDATVIVSFAVSQDGYTSRGLYYKTLLQAAAGNDAVTAAGLNCVCGPSHMLALARAFSAEKPFAAMPNAGYPSSFNGRLVFEDHADYFAEKLAALYSGGADILGGCCGSTPRHLALAVQAINAVRRTGEREKARPVIQTDRVPLSLPRGRKRIAVELDPPLDTDCSYLLAAAAELKACGADLITLADSPLSRTRADSIMTAAKLRREIGVEVLPHLSCRDKNHMALKAGLLGASFEGIRQVLVVTGDPPVQTGARRGDGVFSFHSFDLISYIAAMNDDVFSHKPFLIGGALNVNAVNFPSELERAKRKCRCGAVMLFTQPIFSDRAVENFLLARRELPCALFAGILPVAGYKNAQFLINEVSGIEIPPEVVASLRDKTPAEAAEISIAYSAGIVQKVYAAADGFYIMTPLKKTAIVRGLIEQIRGYEQ